MSKVTIPMPPVTMMISVALPRGSRLRMRLMSSALSVAAFVAPANVTVDASIRAE